MGADLFLIAKRAKNVEKPKWPRGLVIYLFNWLPRKDKKAIVAHFHDSYNVSCVLWTCGMSWWDDVLPHLNSRSELGGRALKDFRDRVAAAKQQLTTNEDLQEEGVSKRKTGSFSLKALHKYQIRKRKELLKFLDRAIENGLPVTCSL